MMSLWDALRMNMMISYQELVRTFPKPTSLFDPLTKVPFPRSLLNLLQKLILEPNILHRALSAVKIWFLFLMHGRYHFG